MNPALAPYVNKLTDYLSLYGFKYSIGHSGKCPLKDHKSHNPFHVGQKNGEPVWFCFACSTGGTIFDLAAELHGYPKGGDITFYDITVRHLSDTLGLEFPELKRKYISPEEIYKNNLYNITRDITNNLTIDPIRDYANTRGWDDKLLAKYNIGSLGNYSKFVDSMKSKYPEKILRAVGLLSNGTSLFEENRIIFTIHDSNGRPVGFTGRTLEPGETKRKYVNSSNSTIFKKSNILYNLHRAKNVLTKNKYNTLYIVEGQADVISLASHGIMSAVAISGTSFTDAHVELIKDFDNVVVCLDADDAGTKSTRKLYSKYKAKLGKDINIMPLPSKTDPDEFINKYGKNQFISSNTILPLQWELVNYQGSDTITAEFWLNKIVKENSIHHDTLLEALSEKTGIFLPTLKRRLSILLLQEVQGMLSDIVGSGKVNMSIQIEKETNNE